MNSNKMAPLVVTIAIGSGAGGAIGGYVTDSGFSVGWAVFGAAALLGTALLLGRHFHLADQKKRDADLPPEIRAVFDRMLGATPGGLPGVPCVMCGGPRGAKDGLQCCSCTDFMRANANNSIHSCGGCGAGFLVAPKANVYSFESDGVSRVFCACCQEYLRKHVSGGNMAMPPMPPGYDAEGQLINVRHPSLSPKETLQYRTHQAQLQTVNSSKARRAGVAMPAPMFIEG